MRADFTGITSLRQLTADEWIRFKQADPKRYAELETELNGVVQKADTPRVLEVSINGFVQNREATEEVRFVNGIRRASRTPPTS